jgi:hypothetical protein
MATPQVPNPEQAEAQAQFSVQSTSDVNIFTRKIVTSATTTATGTGTATGTKLTTTAATGTGTTGTGTTTGTATGTGTGTATGTTTGTSTAKLTTTSATSGTATATSTATATTTTGTKLTTTVTASSPLYSRNLSKNMKKRCKRRIRTQRITLLPQNNIYNSEIQSLSTGCDTDIWELDKIKTEYDSLYEVVNKRKDISVRTNAPSTFGIRKSFHLWRDSKLKEDYQYRMDELLALITTTEDSIRLWLSVVVMKKWTCRQEAMTYINDLDTSIALHELRLDNIQNEYQSVKNLCDTLKTEASQVAYMLMFNEVCFTRIVCFLP